MLRPVTLGLAGIIGLAGLWPSTPAVSASADFSLTRSPGSLTLLAGGNAHNVRIDLTRSSSSKGTITFSVAGLPPGVHARLSPSSTNGGSGTHITLKLSAGAVTGPVRDFKVKVIGRPSSTAGKQSQSVDVSLTVNTAILRAQGLEVTQGIQVDNGHLIPSGLNQSGQSYANLALVAGKLTVARFFAEAHTAPKGVGGVHAVLRAFTGHKELGSPINADYGPTKTLTDLGESGNARVNDKELQGNGTANVYTFTLPRAWTFGTIKLVADLEAPTILPNLTGHVVNYIQQCGKQVCKQNSFTLNNVTFHPTIGVAVYTLRANPGSSTFTQPPPANQVFKEFRAVMPLPFSALVIQPYAADVNIFGLTTNQATNAVEDVAENNGATNAVGVTAASGFGGLTFNIPGGPFGTGGVNDTGLNGTPTAGGPSLVEAGSSFGLNRPLTTVAHELSHQFGLVHASNECGGGQDSDSDDGSQTGEPWSPKVPAPNEPKEIPPDDGIGQLNGIGLNTTVSRFQVIPNAGSFDYMSYCAAVRGGGDPGDWISSLNYQALLNGDFLASLHPARDRAVLRDGAASASASVPSPSGIAPVATLDPAHLKVLAVVDSHGVQITRVGPVVGPPRPQGASAFTLVARGPNGQLLASVPMSAHDGHVDNVGAVVQLEGEIPSAGVARVEITNPVVVASRQRPVLAPVIRVLAPAAGAAVGGSAPVQVRWSTTNPEQSQLTVQVDYSADDGVSWRTIYAGPDTAGVALPGFYFTASPTARVRVRVNDGFNETPALSARFTARDAPPQVTILSPAIGATAPGPNAQPLPAPVPQIDGDAQVQLTGEAFDQRFRSLTGSSLTWFDGAVPLGRGATLSAGPLPPGLNHIRLVARDAAGRTASATVTVRVSRVDLPFLQLRIPASVNHVARQVTVTALCGASATLVIDGQRYALLAGAARRLQVPIAPGRRAVIVHLRLDIGPVTVPFAVRVLRL